MARANGERATRKQPRWKASVRWLRHRGTVRSAGEEHGASACCPPVRRSCCGPSYWNSGAPALPAKEGREGKHPAECPCAAHHHCTASASHSVREADCDDVAAGGSDSGGE